jgi:hypothetical protein
MLGHSLVCLVNGSLNPRSRICGSANGRPTRTPLTYDNWDENLIPEETSVSLSEIREFASVEG